MAMTNRPASWRQRMAEAREESLIEEEKASALGAATLDKWRPLRYAQALVSSRSGEEMRKLVVAATAAALLLTPTVANAASPTMAQFNALKRQVNALKNQVVNLRGELNCFSDEVFPIEQFGGPGPPPEGYVYEKGGASFLTTGLDYPEQGGPYDFLAVAYDPACLSSGRASLASLPLVKPRMPLHRLHG